LILVDGLQSSVQRLARQLRRTNREIKRQRHNREHDDSANRCRSATPECRPDWKRMGEFSGIGCGNKTPGNFRSRSLGIDFSDPPRAAVALDFVELIAVDGNIASRLHISSLAQRP
jgi:hypothetical protein